MSLQEASDLPRGKRGVRRTPMSDAERAAASERMRKLAPIIARTRTPAVWTEQRRAAARKLMRRQNADAEFNAKKTAHMRDPDRKPERIAKGHNLQRILRSDISVRGEWFTNLLKFNTSAAKRKAASKNMKATAARDPNWGARAREAALLQDRPALARKGWITRRMNLRRKAIESRVKRDVPDLKPGAST